MGSGATKDTYSETPHTRERRGSSVLTGNGTTEMVLHNLEHSTAFDKSELKVLQNKFVELAQKQGNPNTITEEEFREALGAIGIIESDQIILHQVSVVLGVVGGVGGGREEGGKGGGEVKWDDYPFLTNHLALRRHGQGTRQPDQLQELCDLR